MTGASQVRLWLIRALVEAVHASRPATDLLPVSLSQDGPHDGGLGAVHAKSAVRVAAWLFFFGGAAQRSLCNLSPGQLRARISGCTLHLTVHAPLLIPRVPCRAATFVLRRA